jgi:hypothetical protein
MKAWTSALPFFTERELGCRHCMEIKLDLDFAAMLPALRLTWDKPLALTSVCRCPIHNKSVGGHPSSLHMTENAKWKTDGCMAADIHWAKWPVAEKLKFARHAHKMGFRVGLHSTFCHIDLGRKLGLSPKPFIYNTWSGEFNPEDIL